ncbi:MAG TPA: hypothetical protein VFC99_17050, partial [Acidimicrobiia bacterium]|nr:hypothetical protein [Acidimicrobiia bacterium]
MGSVRGVRGGRTGRAAGLLAAAALVLAACVAPAPSSTPAAPARLTVFPGATGNIATPPWWNGDCDSVDDPGSHPLGATYRGVEVCGP